MIDDNSIINTEITLSRVLILFKIVYLQTEIVMMEEERFGGIAWSWIIRKSAKGLQHAGN